MMDTMKLLISIALVLSCISGSAFAGDKSQWKIDLITGSFDVASKQDRLRIASGLLHEINAIKAYLPSLTPKQKDWLEAERKSLGSIEGEAFTSKSNAFMRSNEFQLESFNAGLDKIIKALSCVMADGNGLNQELLCWSYANWAITDSGIYNDAIYRLNYWQVVEFTPKIRKQFGLSYSDEDPWGGYHMFGRLIQKNLVMPLIRMDGK